jgi:hypothetical protein
MKNILLAVLLILGISITKAQSRVENFNVGPYEVDYKGPGDINYRLRKGINLFEFYGLEKDTVIQTVHVTEPLKNGVQLDVSFSMPRYSKGVSNVWGIDVSWKQRIANLIYLNTGGLFAMSYGKYEFIELKENIIEFGLPISLEFGKLSKNKAAIYGGVGFVPIYYLTTKEEIMNPINTEFREKPSGFLVAPRLDFGGYIPVCTKLMKMGVYGQYNINCSNRDNNQFKNHIGRFFIGMNLGLIL